TGRTVTGEGVHHDVAGPAYQDSVDASVKGWAPVTQAAGSSRTRHIEWKKESMKNLANLQLTRRNALAGAVALSAAGTLPRLSLAATQDAAWPSATLQIMAPAGAGGGWDTTAREIQRVLGASG